MLAACTLAVVTRRRKNAPHYRKHAAFVIALVVVGTVNIAAWIAPLPRCDRVMTQSNLEQERMLAIAVFIDRKDLDTLGIYIPDMNTTLVSRPSPAVFHSGLTASLDA